MATWKNMTNVTFDEIQVGASADLTRALSQPDIDLLALVSGDVDPFHVAADGGAAIDRAEEAVLDVAVARMDAEAK